MANDLVKTLLRHKIMFILGVIVLVILFDLYNAHVALREYNNLSDLINERQELEYYNTELSPVEIGDRLEEFDNKTEGLYVRYKGTIKNISKRRGKYHVLLTNEDQIQDAKCVVDPEKRDTVYPLREGNVISVKGQFDELFITWDIEDCTIIPNNKEAIGIDGR